MVKSSSHHHSTEKLVSSVQSSHPDIIYPVKSFVLNSNNNMFAGRASDVFNRLSSLENQHTIWMANNETHESFEARGNSIENTKSTSEYDETNTFKKPYLPTHESFGAYLDSMADTQSTSKADETNTFKKPYLPTRESFVGYVNSMEDMQSTSKANETNTFKKPFLPTHESFGANLDSREDTQNTSKADEANTFKKPYLPTHESFGAYLNSMEDTQSTSKVDETNTFKKPYLPMRESFAAYKDSIEDTLSTSKADETNTFKKPYLPVRRNQKHDSIRKKKNTRVWRKYSLKNVPLTTDAKNAAVAFQFLNELRKKREESISKEKSSNDGKIVFRKPMKRKPITSTVTSCTEVSSSSEIAKEGLSKNTDSVIKLDHLQDKFDDE